LFTVSTVPNCAQQNPQPEHHSDPRLPRLRAFLESLGSPLKHLAPDFLLAADRNQLDWRLLPSISAVESGCGKTAVRNNIFGWYSARKGFRTVREGIYHVASRLSVSRLYANKDLDAVLRTYNPRPGYAARVKALMANVEKAEPAPIRASLPRNTGRPAPAE
jgi:hypothetical protein